MEIEQRRALAAALYRGRVVGIEACAELLRVSPRTIRRDLEAAGVPRRPAHRPPRTARRREAAVLPAAAPLELDDALELLKSQLDAKIGAGEATVQDLNALARLEIVVENRRLFEEARELTREP